VWDGQDHIGKLGTYFEDKDNLFPVLNRKWLIGAVNKVLSPSGDGLEQNPMLVLAGAQGKGKSVFVRWLGSPLPDFTISSPIYPENKDFVINSCSHFVWEVEELGSTIRKADIEALKAFLTRPKATFRAPYGHYEIQKYCTASYIGTLNLDGSGFLNDPTGNRRYRVCHLTNIDWNYRKDVDINQVWAQAVALVKGGENYHLDRETENIIQEINDRYSIDDPLGEHVWNTFNLEADKNCFMSTTEILTILKAHDIIQSNTEKVISMRLASVLTKAGLEQTRKRIDGRVYPIRGWSGISLWGKPTNSPACPQKYPEI
jgi:predicted P-loop ATPase